MKSIIHEIIPLLEALPTQGKDKVYEEIQKMMLEWDPEFVKLTPQDEKQVREVEHSGFTDVSEINWD